MYVDLNPVRAALAKSPEESEFTGAKDRLDDLQQRQSSSDQTHDWERSRNRKRSGWMSPVEINERVDPPGPDPETSGRRASRRGFLSMSLSQYLDLLDWTGRQLRANKRGAIPAHLSPILARLGINQDGWLTVVEKFGRLFKRAAGTRASLKGSKGVRSHWFAGRAEDSSATRLKLRPDPLMAFKAVG